MVMRGNLKFYPMPKFQKDFDALSADIQKKVLECLLDFNKDPLPVSRRPHSVTNRGERPAIYTMDVTSNKSYKMSFKIEEGVAFLLRVGTHKTLDRDPGRAEATRVFKESTR